MKTSALVTIVLAVLVIFGGWYWYSNYYSAPAATPTTDTTTNTNPNDADYTPTTDTSGGVSADIQAGVTVGTAPMSATITLTASGFSPSSVTIKKGGTVTFKNESTGEMWVGSAQHPTHTAYSGRTLTQHCPDTTGTAFDQCKSGNTYSFMFEKVGSWSYHNHKNASQFGAVVVVE